jgi:hypothetical protein
MSLRMVTARSVANRPSQAITSSAAPPSWLRMIGGCAPISCSPIRLVVCAPNTADPGDDSGWRGFVMRQSKLARRTDARSRFSEGDSARLVGVRKYQSATTGDR